MNIYDIAKLSGLSKSTVSRVINNESVSPKSREKVLKVIEESNFIPNKNARNLPKNRKMSVVVIVTRLDSYSENRVIRGFIEKTEKEVELMIFESRFCIKRSREVYEAHDDADAYIIFPIGDENYEFLSNNIAPVFFVGGKVQAFNSITFEDEKAIRLLYEHLNPQKKVLYFISPHSDIYTGARRTNTIKNLCKANNIPLDIMHLDLLNDNRYEQLPSTSELMQYDTIICSMDSTALFVQMHLKIKENNIKLGSIGNNEIVTRYMKDFTTVSMGFKRSGKAIANMLLKSKISSKVIRAKLIEIK